MPEMSSPARPSHRLAGVLPGALAILVVACGGSAPAATTAPAASPTRGSSPTAPGTTPPSTGAPTAAPTASPAPTATPTSDAEGGVSHPTGSTAVVLRAFQGGGFVPAEIAMTAVPQFTLYGDGTVIYVPIDAAQRVMTGGQPMPLRTATMNDEQATALLRFALGQAGLADARPDYPNHLIADAPTTTFTVDAGDVTKTVSIMALSEIEEDGPDAAARRRFYALWKLLSDFSVQVKAGRASDAGDYKPERYRASLLQQEGAPAAKAWPWPEIKTSEFGDPKTGELAHRITQEQLERVAPGRAGGGAVGLIVKGTDGKTYSLAIRPLLPDEER